MISCNETNNAYVTNITSCMQVPFEVNTNTSDLEGDLYHLSSSDEENTGQQQTNQNIDTVSD